ncbi:hypothetical protein [Oceanobacillus picturae]|uniref:hypothetical protein n=1 Tax=Oceanobacillus picturae TaxID=171693 RepID=UPI001602E8E2|nr:hypothetical protein [Oceanobacillus picturae]
MIDAGIGKSDTVEGGREAAKGKVAQEELKVKRQPHKLKPPPTKSPVLNESNMVN